MIVQCPVPTCRADNEGGVEACGRCGTPLEAYGRLLARSAWLFNSGLAAARSGELGMAREWFAAIVHWCPYDTEARNALALACFHLGDRTAARHHWTTVERRSPQDAIAARGLKALADGAAASGSASPAGHSRRPRGRRHPERRG
jgi:hypothetical protein